MRRFLSHILRTSPSLPPRRATPRQELIASAIRYASHNHRTAPDVEVALAALGCELSSSEVGVIRSCVLEPNQSSFKI